MVQIVASLRGAKAMGIVLPEGVINSIHTTGYDFYLVPESQKFTIHEISFKNGIRKGFYINKNKLDVMTGDMVCVETESGFDVGRISLSGELVKLQMKKRKVSQDMQFMPILRKATDNDLERMMEGRAMEGATMLKSRVIARELKLDMKIGEVEYQGDKRKATFYYIADDRVDFRELIKLYAKEFRVKIEMRQIGARQEAEKLAAWVVVAENYVVLPGLLILNRWEPMLHVIKI